MNADDLLAKGNGGTRQMFNYVTVLDNSDGMTIETPPDDYSPDKVNESAIEQYQQQRNQLKQ